MTEYAEVWCRECDQPADADDGLCTGHRAAALSHVMLKRAREGLCLDCGHADDIHDRRGDAADAECEDSCDTCIEARNDFRVERQMQEWGRFI